MFTPKADHRSIKAKYVVVGNADWRNKLTTNKREFVEAWVARPASRAAFDNLSNTSYVETLVSNTRVDFASAERASPG